MAASQELKRASCRLSLGVISMACLLAGTAFAGDYYTAVPFLPTVSIGPLGTSATPVDHVYGKEYSHTNWTLAADPNIDNNSDHDAFGILDPLQVVSFDGIPGPIGGNSGSTDAFDYGVDSSFNYPEGQVDALANHGDFLFKQVVANTATLLFSTSADLDAATMLPAGPVIAKAHVHYEAPAGTDGVWAVIEAAPAGPGPGPGVNHHVVEDLDALEVWGPEPPSHFGPDPVDEGYVGPANTADADRFSLDVDSASGVSVWGYDITLKSVFPYIPHFVIVDAVEDLFLGAGLDFDMSIRDMIDVDGTMVRDRGIVGEWDDGDELLFTIDPLIDPLAGGVIADGGEIMHLVNAGGVGVNSFLVHGGHTWDTAFLVAATFGYWSEDVDALEAVGVLLNGDTDIPTPEPTALALLLVGAAILGVRRTRMRD